LQYFKLYISIAFSKKRNEKTNSVVLKLINHVAGVGTQWSQEMTRYYHTDIYATVTL